ncbi:hypothetical protein F4780DRAFT_743849 [Xylariomycetidae sp. FL0641]|nr:hypothetical protein F4780DRAFT_743849 [Xylariomycetidae sp. FL0641]
MSLRPSLAGIEAKGLSTDDPNLMRTTAQRNPRSMRNDGSLTPIDTQLAVTPELSPSPTVQRRHVVIPDPVAFRYLEEDPSVTVVERRDELQGYELYLVEQWACSRKSPTLVIVTYTGDQNHSVAVGVLAVPADEKAWSPRLRIYFKAIQQYHARPKDTPLGEVMVTNLSNFPSALTVISVPEGDIKKHRRIFIVNEDLKRLGCSGRSGMTLSDPSSAAKAKFYQLYKTDERIPFSESVIELIKLCQIALALFGNLDPVYIDGLLCDVTEAAVGDWWTEYGVEYYNIEPTDGILGPTTVCALLGLLMGARNRLSYLGEPVMKDVFDMDATERGIAHFQKYQKLERTRRLDRQTMHRLHAVTAKAAAGEGWGVQKAVKSTVSEIGGKRGELVLGMVGGRDKGGIGDIETVDLDKFISLVSGERAKWLWHGKAKRSAAEHDKSMPDMGVLFGKEEANALGKRTSSGPVEEESEPARRDEPPADYIPPVAPPAAGIAESPENKEAMRRGVFKNVARDARSGLGRIKDVMTSAGPLRGHASRLSRDEFSESNATGLQSSMLSNSSAGVLHSSAPSPVPGQISRAFTWKNKPEEYLNGMRKDKDADSRIPPIPVPAYDDDYRPTSRSSGLAMRTAHVDSKRSSQILEVEDEDALTEDTTTELATDGMDLHRLALSSSLRPDKALSLLHRRHTIADQRPPQDKTPNEARWPRRLSFGDAEEAVLRWEDVADISDIDELDGQLLLERRAQLAELATNLYSNMAIIEKSLGPWVEKKIRSVESMDEYYGRQQEDIQELYQHCTDAYERMKQDSQEIVGEQRAQITEALKEVEVQAAKLEYEINALVSRVQDVEDGATQFEIQVEDVERRAEELKAQLETEGWLHWAVRTLTGIGTGPNITRQPSY